LGRTPDKLAINWQNFAQVGFQLNFAFRIEYGCNVRVEPFALTLINLIAIQLNFRAKYLQNGEENRIKK